MDDPRSTQEFLSLGRQHGATILFTTSIPAEHYDKLLNDVMKLKPKKRMNWKSVLANTCGQHTRVRYIEGGIKVPGYNFVSHFENKLSGQMQSKYGT